MQKLKLVMALVLSFVVLGFVPSVLAEEVKVSDASTLVSELEKGNSVVLEDNITLSSISTSTEDNGRNRAAVVITKSVTIDGNGKTITSDGVKTLFEVYAGDEEVVVTFKNVKLINNGAYARCIDTRTGNIALNLEEATTLATNGSSGADQPLTIGGYYEDAIEVNISKSTIAAGLSGYAIITFNPVKLTITETKISGWTTLYMKGAEDIYGSTGGYGSATSTVEIKDSTLSSVNEHDGESNAFGTIVFEDEDIKVNIVDSSVEASGTGSAIQNIVTADSLKDAEKENVVNVSGSSELLIDNVAVDSSTEIGAQENIKMTVASGVSSNTTINKELFEDPNAVVTKNAEGAFVVVSKYTVKLNTPENGTATVSATEVLAGETVTVETKANENYILKAIKVVDATGKEVEVKDGKFVMPESNVEVTVTYEELIVPNTFDNISMLIGLGLVSILGIAFTKKKLFN